MNSTKLVIGASGFTGSHVAHQLVRRGEKVRAMIRTTSSTAALRGLGLEYVFGDNHNQRALATARARLRHRLLLRGGRPGVAA